MIGEQEELIKRLKKQVHMVMANFSALKNDYSKLVLENANLQLQVSEQINQAEALEQKYSSAKMASGVLVNDEDKEVARTELNKMVREIDNCIALLNR